VPRKQLMRVALAVFGGLAVGIAFIGGLLVVNSGRGFVGCTAATAAGWMIPTLGGLVVGGIAWLLLSESEDQPPGQMTLSSRCVDCGRPLASDWRLCPHCGAMTEGAAEGAPIPPVREPAP